MLIQSPRSPERSVLRLASAIRNDLIPGPESVEVVLAPPDNLGRAVTFDLPQLDAQDRLGER